MRRNIEKIEIKDPPIQDLKNKKSCLKSSCSTGCGCLLLFIIGSLILLKYASGPQVKELKTIPDNFPPAIPIYDKDSIDQINFTSGAESSKVQEVAAFIPKLVLSPILMLWEKKNESLQNIYTWDNFRKFMRQPATDGRDTVEIIWKSLPAEPRFIEKYYQSELEKNNFQIELTSNQEDIFEFSFIKEKTEGVFYLTDDLDKNGTDYFSLTVRVPHQ